MAKNKMKWNTDRMLGFFAISISFITLVIFIYQTNLMRRQNDLSIMPYLMIATSNNPGNHSYELNLKNHGVGPAIIESVILTYQGENYNLADYDHDLLTFLVSIAPALDTVRNINTSTLNKGLALPSNTTYTAIGVRESEISYRLITESIDQLVENGLDLQITYKSIQEERWRINGD